MINLEVCANSVQSVIEAKNGGAIRVELCDNLIKGGTTPPLSWVEKSVELADIQTFAIIRPRGGDFFYSEIEFNTMKRDIHHCGKAGCHGVVIGMLTEMGNVDIERCSELICIAKQYRMAVTFHRAIDRSQDIMQAMEDIISLGCDRILSSGGYKTAIEGKSILKNMIEKAANRIIIMPGSGITEGNISELHKCVGAMEYHCSFRERIESKMIFKKEGLDNYENEYTIQVTNAKKVNLAISNVNKT